MFKANAGLYDYEDCKLQTMKLNEIHVYYFKWNNRENFYFFNVKKSSIKSLQV